MLINKGAIVALAADNADTPLHDAAENGNWDVVRVLLNHGASIYARNSANKTPAMTAGITDAGAFQFFSSKC